MSGGSVFFQNLGKQSRKSDDDDVGEMIMIKAITKDQNNFTVYSSDRFYSRNVNQIVKKNLCVWNVAKYVILAFLISLEACSPVLRHLF